jgi:hypothetical protein
MLVRISDAAEADGVPESISCEVLAGVGLAFVTAQLRRADARHLTADATKYVAITRIVEEGGHIDLPALVEPEPSGQDVQIEASTLDAPNAPQLIVHLPREVNAASGGAVVTNYYRRSATGFAAFAIVRESICLIFCRRTHAASP